MVSNLSLVICAGTHTCALNLADVVEIMRPLPVMPLAGAPEFVQGMSVIRGAPVPVVDLARVFGIPMQSPSTRFVAVRTGERAVALSVESVLGIRQIAPALLSGMPPLLQKAQPELVEAVGALDAELFLVLKAGKLVPERVWDSIREEAA